LARSLSAAAFKAGKRHPRVAVCGERAGRLWAEDKTDEALRLEQLLNELAKHDDVDILCPYPMPQGRQKDPDFERLAKDSRNYARVSTTHHAQDVSLQTRELRQFAEARSWDVAGE